MKYVKFHQNDKHTNNTEKICMTASFITQHNNLVQFHCDFRTKYCIFYHRFVVTLLYEDCEKGISLHYGILNCVSFYLHYPASLIKVKSAPRQHCFNSKNICSYMYQVKQVYQEYYLC